MKPVFHGMVLKLLVCQKLLMQQLSFLYSHQGPENPKAEPDIANTDPILNFAKQIDKQLGEMTLCLKLIQQMKLW